MKYFFYQCVKSFFGAIILFLWGVLPNLLTLGIAGAISYRKHPVKIVFEEKNKEEELNK